MASGPSSYRDLKEMGPRSVQFWADLRDIGRCFHEQEPPKPFRAILDDFKQLETIPINCRRSYMILGLSSWSDFVRFHTISSEFQRVRPIVDISAGG